MQTATREHAPRPAAPPSPVADDAALWAELRTLNEELRVLPSTDLAARAFVETWVAFLAGSIATKLVLDALRADKAPGVLAVALALACAGLVVDVVRLRLTHRRLSAGEALRLSRQRELRRLLQLDDAPVPPLA